MTSDLYDPLTYENLLHGLVLHFELQEKSILSDENVERIGPGPGVYALFYSGSFDPYAPVAESGDSIYVGKAVPPGRRKGGTLDMDYPALQNRLREHVRSIEQTSNLEGADFEFRALPTMPVWIAMAEEAMIKHYRPVWNMCLDGFGNHDPGSGRTRGRRSWWDTLHTGRRWAENLQVTKTKAEAETLVADFFKRTAIP